jgi:hypothetical protein
MIENRIELLLKLKSYLVDKDDVLIQHIELAERQNGWFTTEFIHQSIQAITDQYLNEYELIVFASLLQTAEQKDKQLTVGIVMAGNIPLVGFHDFLCVFLSGYRMKLKLSSKDTILMRHLISKLIEWDPNLTDQIEIADMLKNCDAYIATGSNTSANYFEYYFAKYPNIIRKNRTSVGIITGTETTEELTALADDVYMYCGLGCRNITKLYVPKDYDFLPMLTAFRKYDHLKDVNKYRNNLDYNLALYMINNQFYMNNDSLLLVENESIFSPVAVLHYEYYTDLHNVLESLRNNQSIQAIVGQNYIPFGAAQKPTLTDFADGVNTIEFLNSL